MGTGNRRQGAVEGIKITNNNYPTPFVYTLGAMVWIYKLFADPHNFQEFWKNTNLLFLTISKLFTDSCGSGHAAIFAVGRNTKRFSFPIISFSMFGLSFYELLATIYLLSPVALMDGAWWGQVDSVGVGIFLAAFLLVLKNNRSGPDSSL